MLIEKVAKSKFQKNLPTRGALDARRGWVLFFLAGMNVVVARCGDSTGYCDPSSASVC
jgi:hypothetical protein